MIELKQTNAGFRVCPDTFAHYGAGQRVPFFDTGNYCFVKRKSNSRPGKIPELKGQLGLFSKGVKNGFCLGNYIGTIYTIHNYRKYGSDLKSHLCIETHGTKNRKYVIEPNCDNMLFQWMNDGKHNGKSSYCNVEFVECWIGGFPGVSVWTKCDIKNNEEYFVDYGTKFWKCRT